MHGTILLLIVLVVAMVGGCAGTRPVSDAPVVRREVQRSPGLEARRWRIDAVDGTLPRAPAPYALAGGGEVADRWRASGFRLIRMPRDEIDPLEAALPHVDAVHRAALGEPTVWTPLASAAFGTGFRLGTPGGDRWLGRGRLELLVRGWREPIVRGDPSFRVELALAWVEEGTTRPEVLDHLMYSGTIGDDEALVIVGIPPGEDFVSRTGPGLEESGPQPESQPGPPADTAPAGGVGGVAPLPAPIGGGDDSALSPLIPEPPGPRPAAPLTAGEALLITPAVLGDRPTPARLNVIVLIPSRN